MAPKVLNLTNYQNFLQNLSTPKNFTILLDPNTPLNSGEKKEKVCQNMITLWMLVRDRSRYNALLQIDGFVFVLFFEKQTG